MPQINDDQLYPPTQVFSGCTWPGTTPDGKTVQFTFNGFIEGLKPYTDFVFFNNATRVGQMVLANMPGIPETNAPYNNGDPFFGTLNTFPVTDYSHIDRLTELSIR
jgi:hypothetical protein